VQGKLRPGIHNDAGEGELTVNEQNEGSMRERLYPALGELFEPPDEGLDARLAEVCRLAARFDLAAAERLHALARELARLDDGGRAELHARTFELNPACILYVSVHLFGEESFKRAQLMTGLDEAYGAAGFARGGELPDHLGVILRFAPHFSDEEWRDLCRLCLVGAAAKMRDALARSGNPYSYLLQSIHGLLELEVAREVAGHA